MQKIADMFGVEWREEERKNAVKEAEAVRILNAQLDKRLAEAQARLDAGKGLTATSVAQAPSPATAQ